MFEGIGNLNAYVNSQKLWNKFDQKLKQNAFSVPQNQAKKSQFGVAGSSDSWRMMTIMNTLDSGDKLSPGDLAYLREKSPSLYQKAIRVAKEREELEARLSRCKSKEEASRVRISATQSVAASLQVGANVNSAMADPAEPMMRSRAIEKTWRQYTVSKHYGKLADTELERKNLFRLKRD